MKSRYRFPAAPLAVLLVLADVALFIVAWLRQGLNCDESCYDKQNQPYEAGHAWTSYSSSWQWDAQFWIAAVALIAAGAGMHFVAAGDSWRAAVGVLIATSLSVTWIVWYALAPPIGS
jgi:hypothetical protein